MGPFTVGEIPADPQVFVISDDDGNPKVLTGYTGITARLVQPNGVVVDPIGTISPIDPGQPSHVVLNWGNTSPFPLAGGYQIQIKFTGSSVIDFSKTAVFEVEPVAGTASMPMWATTSDVLKFTNTTSSDENLAAAQGIIDAVSNRTPAASAYVRQRDIEWLKRAVAYQAAWQLSQPDLFARHSVEGLNQDSAIFKFSSKATVYLAPLAERALKNVSWLKSKSLRIQTSFVDGDQWLGGALVDDSMLDWSAI